MKLLDATVHVSSGVQLPTPFLLMLTSERGEAALEVDGPLALSPDSLVELKHGRLRGSAIELASGRPWGVATLASAVAAGGADAVRALQELEVLRLSRCGIRREKAVDVERGWAWMGPSSSQAYRELICASKDRAGFAANDFLGLILASPHGRLPKEVAAKQPRRTEAPRSDRQAWDDGVTTTERGGTRVGVVSGVGWIVGTVANAGALSVQPRRDPSPAPVSVMPAATWNSANMRQIIIDGDYRQTKQGRLRMVLDTDRIAARGGTPALVVTGRATFDHNDISTAYGTPGWDDVPGSSVEVAISDPSILVPGTRFQAVSAGTFFGRPAKFNHSLVEGKYDVMLALDCWSLPGRPGGMDVVVLDIPRYADGSPLTSRFPKRNLIIITHGTASQIADGRPSDFGGGHEDFRDIAVSMQALIQKCGASDDWDVLTVDWRELASNQPFETARLAQQLGESLVDFLIDGLGYGRLIESVQFMGHSSGAWMGDGFADRMAERAAEFPGGRKPRVVLTLFDAFDLPAGWNGGANWPPAESLWSLSTLGYTMLGGLGDTADAVEHYYDQALLGTQSLHGGLSTNAVSIEVSGLDPDYRYSALPRFVGYLFKRHAWPYRWYARTIHRALECPDSCNDYEWRRWGVVRAPFFTQALRRASPEQVVASGLGQALREFPPGTRITLPEP